MQVSVWKFRPCLIWKELSVIETGVWVSFLKQRKPDRSYFMLGEQSWISSLGLPEGLPKYGD